MNLAPILVIGSLLMLSACGQSETSFREDSGVSGDAIQAAAGQSDLGTIDVNFPQPGMEIEPQVTALVVINPQVEFLSPDGVGWGLVGRGVVENRVVDHLVSLFETAHTLDMPIYVSPYEFAGVENRWQFRDTRVAAQSADIADDSDAKIARQTPGSGGDWHQALKPMIENGSTIIVRPHRLYGPESNDLVERLRAAGIQRVILAGMCANLSVEAHLRELVEQGFEVQVVSDATAGIVTDDYDGYSAAMTNFRLIAHEIDTTDNTVEAMRAAYR